MLEKLEGNGIPSGPIYSYDQTLNDPHILAREMVLQYDHPIAGSIQTLGFPAKFSKTPGEIVKPSPLLGEHNDEILKELGYSTEDLERLNNEVMKK